MQNSPRKTNSRFCPSSFKSNNIQFEYTVYLKFLSFFSLVVPIPLGIHFSHSPNTHMWVLCQIPLLLFPIVMLILRVCPRPARNYRPLSKDIHFLGASLQTDKNRKQKEILRTRHVLVLPRLPSISRDPTHMYFPISFAIVILVLLRLWKPEESSSYVVYRFYLCGGGKGRGKGDIWGLCFLPTEDDFWQKEDKKYIQQCFLRDTEMGQMV